MGKCPEHAFLFVPTINKPSPPPRKKKKKKMTTLKTIVRLKCTKTKITNLFTYKIYPVTIATLSHTIDKTLEVVITSMNSLKMQKKRLYRSKSGKRGRILFGCSCGLVAWTGLDLHASNDAKISWIFFSLKKNNRNSVMTSYKLIIRKFFCI